MPNNSLTLPEEGITINFETDISAITKTDFEQALGLADAIIQYTKETGDPYPALDVLRKIERLKNMTSITKAKVLHFLNKFWYEYQIEAPFLETIQTYLGLTNATVVRRYIAIWDMFETNKIPEEFQERICKRPIRDLVPIVGAINQGYSFSEDDWERVLDARDFGDVARIIREDVKGKEPRSHAISYILDKRDGSLYAVNQGERFNIGRLNVATSSPVVRSAILRAINKLGIELYNLEEE